MKRLLALKFEKNGWVFEIVPNRTLLLDEPNWVNLYIPELFGVFDNNNVNSPCVPEISYEDSATLLHPVRFLENTEYEFSLTAPFSKARFNDLRKSSGNPIFPFENLTLMNYVSFNSLHADREYECTYRITGRINFRNSVGTVRLSIFEEEIFFYAEIVTSKLEYEDEFQILLNDLADIHSELILQLDNPAGVIFDIDHDSNSTIQAEIMHLRRLMRPERLPHAISTIIGYPAIRNTTKTLIETSAFVTCPDFSELQTNAIQLEWSVGGHLADVFNGFTPVSLPVFQITNNKDIVENRFVKKCLGELIFRIDNIMNKIDSKAYYPTINNLIKWRNLVATLLNHPFWNDIGDCNEYPHSILIQNRIGYRDFFQDILSFEFGVSLATKFGEMTTSGDLKPIYELYEMWCYCQLYSIISDCCNLSPDSTIKLNRYENGLLVDLKRGTGGCVSGKYSCRNGEILEVKLFYIKQFNRLNENDDNWYQSYSAIFKPDFSIAIYQNKKVHWIHFDSKYRLDATKWKMELTDQLISGDIAKETMHYNRADLHVMHTYRDAILGSRGCYILYPGKEDYNEVFIRHGDAKYRHIHSIPSIGAFPLKPNSKSDSISQKAKLADWIKNIFEEISLSDEYNEETGVVKFPI